MQNIGRHLSDEAGAAEKGAAEKGAAVKCAAEKEAKLTF